MKTLYLRPVSWQVLKKVWILCTIPLSTLMLFSCAASNQPSYQLVWSDEFNSEGRPDSASWTYDIGNGSNGWGNNEIQHYTRDQKNVRVENGLLIIEAVKSDSTWTSARVKSQGRKEWKYGKIQFRAKLPTGVGTWPALWMLGNDISSVGWPKCGEIDIMEHVGRNQGVVQCALHMPSSYGNTIHKAERFVDNVSTEFHVYELVWTENRLEFYVDGDQYYTYAPSHLDDATWPYDKPHFIIMNIAIGGGLGGPVAPTLAHARMEIDYVRVYQRVQ